MAQHLPEPVDPAAFANLEPDFILPEQFFPEQQPNWSGELSLLWTVFSDGIEADFLEFNSGTTVTIGTAEKQGLLIV